MEEGGQRHGIPYLPFDRQEGLREDRGDGPDRIPGQRPENRGAVLL